MAAGNLSSSRTFPTCPGDERRAPEPMQVFGPKPAAETARVVAAQPKAGLAGLIPEAGTPGSKEIRTFLQLATGEEPRPRGFAGIVLLAVLAGVVAGAPPQIRGAFADAVPINIDQLPVLTCTRRGM